MREADVAPTTWILLFGEMLSAMDSILELSPRHGADRQKGNDGMSEQAKPDSEDFNCKPTPMAFPQMDAEGYGSGGMTLRDYFAASTLQGVVSTCCHNYESMDFDPDRWAAYAYKVADAMLAARKKPEKTVRTAVAPDLLAACKALVDSCKGRIPADSSDSLGVEAIHVLRIRAAVAKAEAEGAE